MLQDVPLVEDDIPFSGRPQLQEDLEELLQSMEPAEKAVDRNVAETPAVGDVKKVAQWEHAGASMMRYSARNTADQDCKVCSTA